MWRKLNGMPPVKAVMTAFPYSLAADADSAEAGRMMAEHEIRHLPVVRDGRLIGVIADHDLPRPADGDPVAVGDLCRGPAHVVDLNLPLDRLLAHMVDERLDAALVVKAGRLVGIVTTTDVCRALHDALRERFPGGGDDAA